jgi:hypothetical protein
MLSCGKGRRYDKYNDVTLYCWYGVVVDIYVLVYPLPCELSLSLFLSLSLPPSFHPESCAVLVRILKGLYFLKPSLPGKSQIEMAR